MHWGQTTWDQESTGMEDVLGTLYLTTQRMIFYLYLFRSKRNCILRNRFLE